MLRDTKERYWLGTLPATEFRVFAKGTLTRFGLPLRRDFDGSVFVDCRYLPRRSFAKVCAYFDGFRTAVQGAGVPVETLDDESKGGAA